SQTRSVGTGRDDLGGVGVVGGGDDQRLTVLLREVESGFDRLVEVDGLTDLPARVRLMILLVDARALDLEEERSEERRGGKKRDWSSDVCSSDLVRPGVSEPAETIWEVWAWSAVVMTSVSPSSFAKSRAASTASSRSTVSPICPHGFAS